MKPTLMAVSTAFTLGLSTLALTQVLATNKPDRLGDYYSNEGEVKGLATSPLAEGSLWQMVAVRLYCRSAPGNGQAIVRQFKKGDVLQTEVYRGESDEVLRNPTDRSGKPWMPVRGKSADDTCYVRANQRYIQPDHALRTPSH